MTDIHVVGGGPAGLAAAIHAAREGHRAVVHERNRQCGAKLLVTGGGHCNIGNLRPPGEWPGLFGRRGRFLAPALDFLPRERLCRWMESMGAPIIVRDGFHLYPADDSAKTVRDCLEREARRLGVEFRYDTKIEQLLDDGDAIGLVAAGGGTTRCGAVIVATGGMSYPSTGSDGSGYRLAEQAGHRVKPPCPGLVGLRVDNLDAGLAGLVLPDAEAAFKPKGRETLRGVGELLLTHSGVSGPAILDLSASVAESLAAGGRARVDVRWVRGMGTDEWLGALSSWRSRRGKNAVANLLREYLPQRLAHWLCGAAGLAEGVAASSLTAAERERLVGLLAAFPAGVVESEGWGKAMITRGGVDLADVDPKTMASRKKPGLHFAGEVLDLDGPCGGYNLHWAFAGGALAGYSAAKAR